MTDIPFKDRALNKQEFEQLRLMLSIFRDGTGQVVLSSGETMPGFRDYERTIAALLDARAPEDKGIFDVHVESDTGTFGISCKMAKIQPPGNNCTFMELSNSAAKFEAELNRLNIDWTTHPQQAGEAVVNLVTSWHLEVQEEFALNSSRYVVLSHDAKWEKFELICLPLDLRNTDPLYAITWKLEGRSLNGYIKDGERTHRLWQFYRYSGGQLKYFPLKSWAIWSTPLFHLETPQKVSLKSRAKDYFPKFSVF